MRLIELFVPKDSEIGFKIFSIKSFHLIGRFFCSFQIVKDFAKLYLLLLRKIASQLKTKKDITLKRKESVQTKFAWQKEH